MAGVLTLKSIYGYSVLINKDHVKPSARGRPRGRPALPLDRIVEAALELVDEQGADALSMRSLAQRLGSGTATLYRHFANRAELIATVVDSMFGEIDFEESGASGVAWQQACISFAQRAFDALARHGSLAPLLIGHIPMGPNALAHREYILSLLLRNGFAPEVAARSYATLWHYILGFAMQVREPAAKPEDDERDLTASAAFRQLEPERYPATHAVADSLPVELAEEFTFGLRLIVTGLERVHA